jgi:hypothetical protein
LSGGAKPKPKKSAKRAAAPKEAVAQTEKPTTTAAKKKTPIGPRFSVFRESITSDQE